MPSLSALKHRDWNIKSIIIRMHCCLLGMLVRLCPAWPEGKVVAFAAKFCVWRGRGPQSVSLMTQRSLFYYFGTRPGIIRLALIWR
jgi:hypothetical protein